MPDIILVINAGSSSIKFSLFPVAESPESLFRGQIEGLAAQPRFTAYDATGKVVDERSWAPQERPGYSEAIRFLLERIERGKPAGNHIAAAGHRVVHGGQKFTGPVWFDAGVLQALRDLVPLAPLHQPHNIAAIEAVSAHAPNVPQAVCFDTSFHRSQPPVAQAFGLPRALSSEGIVRYGFHGLSYEYIASALPALDSRAAAGRTIVAHLGNGASLCGLVAGRSMATTMGFTALDGLLMGTRCGALDPGVLLYLLERHRMDVRSLERLLYEQSGLLGVSGISSDMRTLLASADPHAAEAVDLFVYRIGRELGSLAAALGGLDAVIFTGGIGENSPAIRDRVCADAGWLGIDFDAPANEAGGPRISRPDSSVDVWVVPTNEELMIANHTRRMLNKR